VVRVTGYTSNFYILDLENFATASHRCIAGTVNELVDGQLVDYICDGRARRG